MASGTGRAGAVHPVPRPQPPGPARVFQLCVWPLRDDAPGGRTKIAIALGPDGALEISGKLVVVPLFGLWTDIDVSASTCDPAHRAGHQSRAGLQDIDDRVAALVCVGPIQHEKVRKSADGHAQVGTRVGSPTFVQIMSSGPDHIDAGEVA